MKFKEIKDGLTNVVGLTEELQSVYINDIYKKHDKNILVITSSLYEANKLYSSLSMYTSNLYLFPMDNFITTEASIGSPELEVNRLETLNSISQSKDKNIVITNLMGLLRFLPTKEKYINSIIKVEVGKEYNKEKLYRDLCINGYKTSTLVTRTGEISNRGYILDIFPINEDNAIRIEFFGDEIDSIRYFDVNTQLSIKKIQNITITPFSEFLIDDDVEENEKKQSNLIKYGKVAKITDYLDNPITIYIDYSQIYNSYLMLNNEILEYSEEKNKKYMHNLGEFNEKCGIYISSVDNILPNLEINETHVYESFDVPFFNDDIDKINKSLNDYLNLNKTVIICLDSDLQLKNFIKVLEVPYNKTTMSNIKEKSINVVLFPIKNGYIYDDYVVISSSNIFKNIINKSLYKSKFKIGTRIKNIDSLEIGDYVVHDSVGIGRYEGIVALKKGNIIKDYLKIKYRDDGVLYIPVEKIELITKYTAKDGREAILNKLGGTDWQKTKLKVREKMHNIALELLKVAALRKSKIGFAFKEDSPLQSIFESEFEYEETKDQLAATNLIKKEMELSSPMDMLLCGDVGYGKTEVAFRAMFKAVCNNKQVAYLCPTTILSNQQYTSALDRFKNFPVNIALLNRFTSKKEKDQILENLKNGKIDILIGTHRI